MSFPSGLVGSLKVLQRKYEKEVKGTLTLRAPNSFIFKSIGDTIQVDQSIGNALKPYFPPFTDPKATDNAVWSLFTNRRKCNKEEQFSNQCARIHMLQGVKKCC